MEWFYTLGMPESERQEVTALNLWEASYLSFDRPLPGKPSNIPDRLSPFSKSGFFHITTQSPGGEENGKGKYLTRGPNSYK